MSRQGRVIHFKSCNKASPKIQAKEGNIRTPSPTSYATRNLSENMDVFLISETVGARGRERKREERRGEGVQSLKTSPQSRCRRSFLLKPDRSDRQTGGNSSQITSTGDWRVDHMTVQSRCVCALGGCALMRVRERVV